MPANMPANFEFLIQWGYF